MFGRALLFLLLLVAGANAQTGNSESPLLTKDTSLASRLELAQLWIQKTGIEEQGKLIVGQGIQEGMDSIKTKTEKAERAKQKVTTVIREEAGRIVASMSDTVAVHLAASLSISELLECINSEDGMPSDPALRRKVNAITPILKDRLSVFESQFESIFFKSIFKLDEEELEALMEGMQE